jgi:hypothetical protein
VIAGIVKRLRRRERDGCADPSADDDAASVRLDVGRFSERSDDVENAITCAELIEQRRGLADGLNDQRDGSAFRVGAL